MTYDLSQFKKADVDPREPHMRVLKCMICRSIEEVPDYEGPEGGENTMEFDTVLKFFTDQHVNKGCKRDDFSIIRFPTRFWMIPKVKEGIVAQLKEGAQGLDVFGTNFYDTKNNFTADAMSCWMREHNQTKDCEEYKHDKKRLKPGTAVERAAIGLEKEMSGPKVYLCDYCPVKSIVQEKAYKKKGLYK
jgi:hypothetical protein